MLPYFVFIFVDATSIGRDAAFKLEVLFKLRPNYDLILTSTQCPNLLGKKNRSKFAANSAHIRLTLSKI